MLPIAIPFVTIVFLLLIGAGLRQRGMVTATGARQMTGLVLNVSLPALIWVTLASEITARQLGRAPLLAGMGVAGTLLGYAVGGIAARWPLLRTGQRATFQTAVAVTNTAFIGYPLCQALLGSTGLLYAVLYDVGLTVVMSTFSIWLLSRAADKPGVVEKHVQLGSAWVGLLRSPMMWALVLGEAWGALGWATPDWLVNPLRTLGQCTTPLALLSVGMLIRRPTIASDKVNSTPARAWSPLLTLALLRLLIVPALIAVLVILLRVERVAATVIVLQAAVPSAVCTTAMVEQYGGDSSLAASGVVVTTMLSLLTLPVWSALMIGRP